MSRSRTPVEDAVRAKITESLGPTILEIHNDSHMHSHHKAMQGSASTETHFRLLIVSDAFKAKPQPARHRMVYALLNEELSTEGGIHALQLKTQTIQEQIKQVEREQAQQGEHVAAVENAS